MGNYKIGANVAGLVAVSTLSNDATDPHPTQFVEYSEIVGADLNGAPIEAGLPRCVWKWEQMDAKGFDALVDYYTTYGGIVYITTRTNVFASTVYTFANYKTRMARPTGETIPNKRYQNIEIVFTALEVQ